MNAHDAHALLDRVREGRPVPLPTINEALAVCGDLNQKEDDMKTIIDTNPREPWKTSTGVHVGILAPKRLPVMSRDEERIQAAMLDPRTTKRTTKIRAIAGSLLKGLI